MTNKGEFYRAQEAFLPHEIVKKDLKNSRNEPTDCFKNAVQAYSKNFLITMSVSGSFWPRATLKGLKRSFVAGLEAWAKNIRLF